MLRKRTLELSKLARVGTKTDSKSANMKWEARNRQVATAAFQNEENRAQVRYVKEISRIKERQRGACKRFSLKQTDQKADRRAPGTGSRFVRTEAMN